MIVKITTLAVTLSFCGITWAGSGMAQEPGVMTGTWHHRISGDRFDTCIDLIEQVGVDLSTEITCTNYGSGTTNGSIDPETGQFFLSGIVGGYALQSEGTLSLDGSAIGGSWNVADPPVRGTFVGILQQPATPTDEPSVTPLPTATELDPREAMASATATPAAAALPETGQGSSRENSMLLIAAFAALIGAMAVAGGAMRWHRSRQRR